MLLRPDQIRLLAVGLPPIPANGKGSSPPPAATSQSITQSTIAPEAMPYYQSLLARAQGITQDPNDPTKPAQYPNYPGQLVAGMAPLQQQAIDTGQGISGAEAAQAGQGMGNMGLGSLYAQQAGQGAFGVGQQAQGLGNSLYGSGQGLVGGGVGTAGGGAGLMGQAGLGSLGVGQSAPGLANTFSQDNLQQWMNPYQQGVTDIAKEQANRQFAQQQNTASAQAASHGALGGYRDQLRGANDQFNQNTLLNNIQMQGGQQAYNTALQAMGQQGQLGVQAGQLGLQGYGQAGNIGQGIGQLGVGIGQLGATQEGQALNAGQLGLAGYGQAGTQGTNLANIGGQQINTGQQGINNLQTLGALQQTQQQNQLNAAYSQFQNASAYPQQQLGFLSGILRGIPVNPSTDTTQFQAPPSIYGQLAGIGQIGAGIGSLASKIGGT